MKEQWRKLSGKYRYEDLSPKDQTKLDELIVAAADSAYPEVTFWELISATWSERMVEESEPDPKWTRRT